MIVENDFLVLIAFVVSIAIFVVIALIVGWRQSVAEDKAQSNFVLEPPTQQQVDAYNLYVLERAKVMERRKQENMDKILNSTNPL